MRPSQSHLNLAIRCSSLFIFPHKLRKYVRTSNQQHEAEEASMAKERGKQKSPEMCSKNNQYNDSEALKPTQHNHSKHTQTESFNGVEIYFY